MTQTMQRDLFTADETPPPTAGLFADVVFDRPLDHAFTYAVGDDLRDRIAVGKRVRAPFGRGDKGTVGFVVRLSETPPERDVKEIVAVLDEEPLLTDNLMRLTRWMADYYLCGWGQVLNAVVPAGARDKAGTRNLNFIEAVPENELPPSPPSLTEKQTCVLEQLRQLGRAVELKQLTRLAKCGSGPIEALVTKGMARRVVKRVDKFTDTSEEAHEPLEPLTLNEDQQRVWEQVEPALKSGGFHAFLLYGVTGSGKTEDLSAGHRGSAAPGQGSAGPRAGDQFDAADDPALQGSLRRSRRIALAPRRHANAAATGGVSRQARCRSSSAPAARSSLRRATSA